MTADAWDEADLFAPAWPPCGECVVWNGLATTEVGSCSILGARRRDQEGCRRFFPKHQLHAALYGRQPKARA